jgi:hypothetical protein
MVHFKSAKEINEQKWRKMRKILEKVREGPMTLSEIELLTYSKGINRVGKRTIQNYMAELNGLGLVVYDPVFATYSATETKRVFKSKQDYNIALKHSKNLLLSTSKKQRLDQMNPLSAFDLIMFPEDSLGKDIYDFCLLQHIKTGYHETNKLMEKYKQSMDKLGYSKVRYLPKLNNPIIGEAKTKTTKANKQMRKLHDLRALLVGKIYTLVDEVKNGIPLEGSCKYCPTPKLTIKDK